MTAPAEAQSAAQPTPSEWQTRIEGEWHGRPSVFDAAARMLRRNVPGLTAAAANNALRTLYLESYRDATAIHQAANSPILSHAVRIGTLDVRICMACLALHGTELRIGERVKSHHQCHCTSIGVTKGSKQRIETGKAYLERLPEGDQQRLMGKGAW